jgi:hypothetical protein
VAALQGLLRELPRDLAASVFVGSRARANCSFS